jgi:hypothetical protein
MSSQPSATHPVIELKPSAGLAVFVFAVHTGGALCLWLTPIPVWITIVISILLLISAALNMQRYALLIAPLSICKLQRRGDEWLLTQTDNTQYFAELMPASIHSRLFAILNFQRERRRWIVPLCPDMCTGDEYRRIRQYLTVMSGSSVDKKSDTAPF